MNNKQKYSNVEMDLQTMRLTQMGAKIKTQSSKSCYIEFDVDNIFVSYFYSMNRHGKYFLSRVLPYPLSIDEFKNENDLIDLIKQDIEQFKNASHSHNIDQFIFSNQLQIENIKMLEDLFLFYNVDKKNLDEITRKIKELQDFIVKSVDEEKRVYEKNDPTHLNI